MHELLTALTRHLHAFAREVRLTEAEWSAAIEFLTATGHITDDRRQEFILLSDVLGLSMQTITINHPVDETITESTVLGPFFVDGAPGIDNGGDLAFGATGEPCWVEGTVRDEHGVALAGARLEVWEADDDGLYDVQYAEARTSARGHLFTEDDGSYRFWALTPTPVPDPGRRPGRPTARGHRPLADAGAAPALHGQRGRVPDLDHPHLRRRRRADRRQRVRRPRVSGQDLRPAARGQPTPDGRVLDGTWSRTRFDIVLAASA